MISEPHFQDLQCAHQVDFVVRETIATRIQRCDRCQCPALFLAELDHQALCFECARMETGI